MTRPTFQKIKADLRVCLTEDSDENWEACIEDVEDRPAREMISPLIACLPLGGRSMERAISALGRAVERLIVEDGLDAAQNLVRRLMWHMNDDSGNIGWGIPEAMAEILAKNSILADRFHIILISYITITGHEDNYCDYAPLRLSCFKALGRLARVRPDLVVKGQNALRAGLQDEDKNCRAAAAEVLDILANADVDA